MKSQEEVFNINSKHKIHLSNLQLEKTSLTLFEKQKEITEWQSDTLITLLCVIHSSGLL